MPRKISNGVVGRNVLGAYFSSRNVLATIENDQDIQLSPNGTGETVINSNLRINSSSSLVFDDNSEENTISIQSPEVTSNYTLTLPSDIGEDGFVLTVDGSGNLSFASVAVSVDNQTADTDTYYPTLITSTSGQITDISVSSSKLSFQPSSGTLSVEKLADSQGRVLTIEDSSGSTVWGG